MTCGSPGITGCSGGEAPEPRTGAREAPDWRLPALLVAALLVARVALPLAPVDPPPWLLHTVSLAYMLLLVYAAARLAILAALHPWPAMAISIVFGVATVFLRASAGPPPLGTLQWSVADVTSVLWWVGVGAVFSRVAREANIIPPIAAAAAAVDFVVIFSGGFTVKMLERHPEVVEAASTGLPALGAASAAAMHVGLSPTGASAIVGAGDLLFIGFFLAAAARFVFDLPRTILWAASACVIAMATVLATHLPLPGLPFIALACIVTNLGRFRYSRAELISLAVVALLLIAFCVWLAGSGPPAPPSAESG